MITNLDRPLRDLRLPAHVAEDIANWFEHLGMTPEEAIDAYKMELGAQFDALQTFLAGRKFDDVLDIGCGYAGTDALLAMTGGSATFHLLDGTGAGSRQQWTHGNPEPWHDVEDGATVVRMNAPEAAVLAYPADPNLTIPADLIMSLKSWCHHYPAHVYLGLVQRSLRPGGLLVVDIRRHTPGLGTLIEAGFRPAAVLEENKKSIRHVFEAPTVRTSARSSD